MNKQYEKLKTLLQELFQLDRPDLDFGLYRVMHAKSAEVTQFLDKDLLPQVQAAFAQYHSADKAEIQKELDKVKAGVEAAGMNPNESPKVQELQGKLANESVDVAMLEREVYDHLYAFFRRYYSEGDYLAKRVYKPGVYAIPYEGEEVALHWANKDQYYIKSSEYLRDYAFRLRPDNEANPLRVHFRLVDATEGEHGNVKAAEGKERRFALSTETPLTLEHGELVVRFTYRPNGTKQADLNAEAEATVLGTTDPAFAEWVAALGALAPTEKDPKRTVLAKHLKGYSDRNTFDYFIHKDLGTFLRRELDFYIKNEVMHLDDVENETAPRVEQYLSKVKVIRRIAGKIIDFLAQLENFQKKLWLKKKFVVETSYCIRLGIIPEAFHPEIAANTAQREEWVQLCGIDAIAGDIVTPAYSVPLTVEFLKACPSLMVDTRHFAASFVARLLETMPDLDEHTDGVLMHSENFQGLALMQKRHRESVQCIYIDPPYNTGSDGFAYRDSYQHSTWASMIVDRLGAGLQYLTQDGAIFASIDEVEQPLLRLAMDSVLGRQNFVADLTWAAGRKNDSRLISVSHEYIVTYARDREFLAATGVEWRQRKKGLDEIYAQYERIRRQFGVDYKSMTKALKQWYRNLPDSHPSKAHRHYCHVDERGVYFPADISWPGGGGPMYEVLHPTTGKPVAVPKSGWRFPQPETMAKHMAENRIHFGDDETTVPCRKSYLREHEYQAPYSVFYQDGRAATRRLREVLGVDDFGYPKDETVVADLVNMLAKENEVVLDFFAGSGTTGHAVINLNREDGGRRKFILVEMGDYFDTVLLPRIKKVTYTPEWKDGKPKRLATAEEADRGPRIVKVVRLESYEDTLNNLEANRIDAQQRLLDSAEAQGADGFKEQYILQYMLDVETRGSQSLLNVQAFRDPTSYTLKVKRPGTDESRAVNVDLMETFNWLLGLSVQRMKAPQAYNAAFERDAEGRLRITADGLSYDANGAFWFRAITGRAPDGRNVLVIWRKLTGNPEEDNLVLDTWFGEQGYDTADGGVDVVFVNGTNNLESRKTPTDRWSVRLIEEDFHRLMFEGTEG